MKDEKDFVSPWILSLTVPCLNHSIYTELPRGTMHTSEFFQYGGRPGTDATYITATGLLEALASVVYAAV